MKHHFFMYKVNKMFFPHPQGSLLFAPFCEPLQMVVGRAVNLVQEILGSNPCQIT